MTPEHDLSQAMATAELFAYTATIACLGIVLGLVIGKRQVG